MKAFLAAVTAVLLSLPAFATAGEKARVAGELFTASCIAHLEDEKGLAAWPAKKSLARAEPDFARAVLQGDAGEVWLVPSDAGEFLLILGPGNCEVWARRADAAGSLASLQETVARLGKAGLEVTPEADREREVGGVKYRHVAYFAKRPGAQAGWLLLGIVAPAEQADVQVRLSATRAR